jgi:hypothetical protein
MEIEPARISLGYGLQRRAEAIVALNRHDPPGAF